MVWKKLRHRPQLHASRILECTSVVSLDRFKGNPSGCAFSFPLSEDTFGFVEEDLLHWDRMELVLSFSKVDCGVGMDIALFWDAAPGQNRKWQACCKLTVWLFKLSGRRLGRFSTAPIIPGDKGPEWVLGTYDEESRRIGKYLTRGPVRLKAEIEFLFSRRPDMNPPGWSFVDARRDNALNLQLGEAYSSSDDFDFVLVSSDGVEIPVHRLMLRARSPVFAAMLSHDTKEAKEKRCVIRDVDGRTLNAMVRSLYIADNLQAGVDVEKLCAAADKYLIVHMKELCETVLAEIEEEKGWETK